MYNPYIHIILAVKRKNIRKLISDKSLNFETKEAQKAEKDRLERLKQRAKATIDEDEARVVLEEDLNTKDVLVEVGLYYST